MYLCSLQKGWDISIFIVGHVTKEGTVVAGPRVLEHMVDTVLYFEGDRHASYRILARCQRTGLDLPMRLVCLRCGQNGLVEVENPSEYMLSGRPEACLRDRWWRALWKGPDRFLMEIQALVCRSNFGMPRRTAAGTGL